MKKYFYFFILLFLTSSCLTREEVEAVIFLNNFNNSKGSMSELCDKARVGLLKTLKPLKGLTIRRKLEADLYFS